MGGASVGGATLLSTGNRRMNVAPWPTLDWQPISPPILPISFDGVDHLSLHHDLQPSECSDRYVRAERHRAQK